MSASVCALVVTFNRCDCLTKVVSAILDQSAQLTDLVIYDNHSSDDTQKMLNEQGLVPHMLADGESSRVKMPGGIAVHCLRGTENSGGSGGFHGGMKYARSLNDDYVWAMDDDVLPDKNCLRTLLAHMTDDRRICIPNRTTGMDFKDYGIVKVNMTNPLLYNIDTRKKRIDAGRLSHEVTDVRDMPFEGPLIASSLIDEIGLPNKDLFIIFDDSDYCTRALNVTTVGFVRSAHLYKQIIPQVDHSRLMGWKDYYGLRNQYWFDRRYGKNWAVRCFRPILSRCDLTLRAIVRRKWSNIRVISRAYHDGTHDRLGKTVEPGGEV